MDNFSSPSGRPHFTVQGFGLSPVPVGSEAERAGLTRPLSSGCSASMVGDQASAHVNSTGTAKNRVTEAVPRFLILTRKDGINFDKVSPFHLQKVLYGLYGELKMIKKIKDGILVEAVTNKQATRILATSKLGDFEVTVTPHKTMNTSRGVIFCRDLLNCSVEEICEELNGQKVIEVRRIKSKRNGELVDTANHIITFNTPILPKTVKVAFYNLNVRLYVPPPLRCFRCNKFGHTSFKCEAPQQMCICGKLLHEGSPCPDPIVCVNCGGAHSARATSCPVYKNENAIQELRVRENISYIEAKKKITFLTPTAGISYAKASTSNQDNQSKIDVPALAKELLPLLVGAITPLLQISCESSKEKPFLVPSSSHETLTNVDQIQMEDESRGAKRKILLEKSPSTDSSITSVDDSTLNEAKNPKKKKGWPKGKPRGPRASESKD